MIILIKKIILMLFCIIIFTECSEKHSANFLKTEAEYTTEGNIKVFTCDFPSKYKNVLKIMFGENYTIGEKQEKYLKVDACCKHTDNRDKKYNQWCISYKDGDKNSQNFILNNKETLAYQTEKYLEELTAKYYEENFLNTYFEKIPLTKGSYVFCFLTDINVDQQDVEELYQKTCNYRRNLETPEGCIHFSKLKMNEIFQNCPVYLSFHISLDTAIPNKENELLQKKAHLQTKQMIQAIMEFTNYNFNATISVCNDMASADLYNGHEWRWAYVKGKEIARGFYYERNVYAAYEGVFW